MRSPTPAAVLTLVAALCALLAACGRPAPGPAGPPSVVCTTGMIADAARAIAGEHARVVGLMGEGVDPHLYKATPGDVAQLSAAALVLSNGLHLEGRLGQTLERLDAVRCVPVGEAIDPALLRAPPDFAGHPDPHVWFDVSMWSQAIGALGEALAQTDPAHADDFRRRTREYQDQLALLHTQTVAAMATIPPDRRVLITAHDAFGYFGRAYGLEVHAIQGISTESEASLKDVNALVELLVSRRVPAVFFESSVPRKTVESLIEGSRARGHEVTLGGELFSDALGKSGTPEGTYIGMVRHNVTTIVRALGGTPPAEWVQEDAR